MADQSWRNFKTTVGILDEEGYRMIKELFVELTLSLSLLDGGRTANISLEDDTLIVKYAFGGDCDIHPLVENCKIAGAAKIGAFWTISGVLPSGKKFKIITP